MSNLAAVQALDALRFALGDNEDATASDYRDLSPASLPQFRQILWLLAARRIPVCVRPEFSNAGAGRGYYRYSIG